MKYNAKQLKEMANVARANALRAIVSARSGHVGIVLGAADIMTAVYANFFRSGRDWFVLSAGHGSALLYSVLNLCGYNVGDLSSFRKLGGLPGHPESGIPGVSVTTGPLGQGIGNAVGLALAEKIRGTNGIVYCLCGDGDLSEGIAQESIALAGLYGLDNLVLLWDDNNVTIDGMALTDVDVPARMLAAGWRVVYTDGNDGGSVTRAIAHSGGVPAPLFVDCQTTIGCGCSVAGTARAHGLEISVDELNALADKFFSDTGLKLWRGIAKARASRVTTRRVTNIPMRTIRLPDGGEFASTRELSGMYLAKLLTSGVKLIGGSADLAYSTNAKTSLHRDVLPPRFAGNFINYGVREHAMGAIMNGIAATGMRPYGSTFLAFSDYMRPSIRLAALSNLPVIYLFTHDSIAVGEDGPTHQPVEQLASLRLIPNVNVFRPCNMAEIAYSWQSAIADTMRPSCIILSRQKFKQIATPKDADISRGAYVIQPARARVRGTIIATGAEVALAVAVAEKLKNYVQVVSMPSVETFMKQPVEYKEKILRGYVLAIEASSRTPWYALADAVVGIDEFGTSGDGADVYATMGFDVDKIADEITKKIKNNV